MLKAQWTKSSRLEESPQDSITYLNREDKRMYFTYSLEHRMCSKDGWWSSNDFSCSFNISDEGICCVFRNEHVTRLIKFDWKNLLWSTTTRWEKHKLGQIMFESVDLPSCCHTDCLCWVKRFENLKLATPIQPPLVSASSKCLLKNSHCATEPGFDWYQNLL